MASSSWKGDVIIWDMTTISPKVQLNGHSEGILLSFTVLITLITVGGIHKMSLVYISVVKLWNNKNEIMNIFFWNIEK